MWFRRDLRLADNPALIAAGIDGAEVVPVFVVDPAFAASGAPRLAYLHDALSTLDAEIRRRSGTGLVIRHGDPVDTVPRLAEEAGADTVFVSRDYAPYGRDRDAAVAAALRSNGRSLQGVGSPYAVAPGAVRKSDGDPYAVFTPFSKVWRQVGWGLPTDAPDDGFRWLGAGAPGIVGEPLPARADPACDLPPAGEEAAHDLWSQFLGGGIDGYPDRRNLPGVDGTSRLSPALKWGTIHPRQLLADLDASGAGPKGHTVFSSELAWREFYADVLFQQPRTAWENLNGKMDAMPVDTDAAARRRFDLWAAGTGTDAAPYFRVFNPTLQQERYDPDGEYVSRWVPEPVAPMLDHRTERDEALRRLASIR
jgi:deoxyribodipyrimidine photo-lyase